MSAFHYICRLEKHKPTQGMQMLTTQWEPYCTCNIHTTYTISDENKPKATINQLTYQTGLAIALWIFI
jgi:hypothetical protein